MVDAPMMARLNRERVLLLGGQRALIMQLAHPLVAAGVAQHSDFPARALERLRRTLDLSLAMIFGTPEEAEAATAAIRAVHDRVTGVAGDRAYEANDPNLLLWVNATLIDTTLQVYVRFVRPLSQEERRRYYDETKVSAAMFGIAEEVIPHDLEAFETYLRETLAGPQLRATEDGHRLVAAVLRPPLPLPLRVPTALVRQVTLALLPPEIRDLFGLRAGPLPRATLAGAALASRLTLPLLPPVLREFSQARSRRATAR